MKDCFNNNNNNKNKNINTKQYLCTKWNNTEFETVQSEPIHQPCGFNAYLLEPLTNGLNDGIKTTPMTGWHPNNWAYCCLSFPSETRKSVLWSDCLPSYSGSKDKDSRSLQNGLNVSTWVWTSETWQLNTHTHTDFPNTFQHWPKQTPSIQLQQRSVQAHHLGQQEADLCWTMATFWSSQAAANQGADQGEQTQKLHFYHG